MGQPIIKQRKIMDLEVGKLIGEDFICFQLPNTYSVKVESPTASMLYITHDHFNKKYKRMLPPLRRYFSKRQALIQQTIDMKDDQ